MAAYNSAVAAKIAPQSGTLQELIEYYQENTEFTELAPRTRLDYVKQIAIIEREFGDFPLAALVEPETRGVFKQWRSNLAKSSKRQADYAWVVLARILSVAKDHGKIGTNPCEKGGRLYGGSRRDKVWTLEQEAAYLDAAPAHMRLPILLGAWTGQRQGDLLRFPWSGYDGKFIRLRQSKTGVHVCIPVVGKLKEALDAEKARKRGLLVLLTKKGEKWTEHGFRASWRKACIKAGISGLTFHDLRGTAVHRLALAGCNETEIAIFTGLSIGDVRGVLERHYLHRDPKIAEAAGAKLDKLAETGTGVPNSVK
jgi:integrase